MAEVEVRSPGLTRWWRLSPVGLLVGAGYFLISWSPSLLPRTWYFQGLVSGLCAVAGYGLGVLLAWLARHAARLLDLRVTVREEASGWLRAAAYVFGAVTVVGLTVTNARSQERTASYVRLEPLAPYEWVMAIAVAVAVVAAVLALARGLRALTRWLARAVGRYVPRAVASVLATVVVVVATVWVTDNVVFHRGLEALAGFAAQVDQRPPPGRSAPTSTLRSGGPGSLEPFDTLGFQGQMFVTNAPSAADIEAATGRAALEPIRVYAGGPRSRTTAQLADAVVAELERTGAFERRVVAVLTATGTGWVDDWSAQSLEYLTDGDCAIASMQYSYVWSALSIITDPEVSRVAGRALFEAVRARIQTMPEGERPLLVVGGESLGSYGGHGAFADVEDMIAKADGGVWVGTPSFTEIPASLTRVRNLGSPQIVPVVDQGRHVRFAASPADLTSDYYGRPYGGWEFPRFVYAQHPSDPVVWWDPAILGSEPDWLREPRGRDVNPDVTWIPFVTFWQLTTDMPIAHDPPEGFGHRYGPELVSAWGAVLGDEPGRDYSGLVAGIERTVTPAK